MTKKRSDSNRIKKLSKMMETEKMQMERLWAEKAKCTQRNSKFALDANHQQLKELIEKREKELKSLIEDSKSYLGDAYQPLSMA